MKECRQRKDGSREFKEGLVAKEAVDCTAEFAEVMIAEAEEVPGYAF